MERSGRRKEISPRASIFFSTESEETDGCERLEQSKSQSCDLSKKKTLVYGGQDEEDRHVILDIIPCVVVTSLETGAFVAFAAFFDMLMVRGNLSARSRKEGTQGAVAFLSEKKVQGCVSQSSDPMNSILPKAGELRLNASAGLTMKFSECTWTKLKFVKEKDNLEALSNKGELHERNPCAPGFEETSRKEDCDSKAAWNLA